jgi:hypothetical protein
MFGREPRSNISLGTDFWGDEVTSEENELLEAQYSEEEIKKAIFDCYAEGAPGPDRFSFLFFSFLPKVLDHHKKGFYVLGEGI